MLGRGLAQQAAIGQADTAQIEIEIDGSGFPYGYSPAANGLTIDSGHCVVQGLSIIGFYQGWAIQIGNDAGDVGNVIVGNFIGTDTTGESSGGNAYGIAPGAYTLVGSKRASSSCPVDAAGDSVGIDDSTIAGAIQNELNVALNPWVPSNGSLFAAEENIISGNYSQLSGGYGVSGGQYDVIAGNLIGPDAAGHAGHRQRHRHPRRPVRAHRRDRPRYRKHHFRQRRQAYPSSQIPISTRATWTSAATTSWPAT